MIIKAPSFVRTREQKKYYKAVLAELNKNGIAIKTIDTFALGTLAINLALIDECMISISKDGAIMESATEKGTTRKANPNLGLLRDANLAARAYYKEFHMSPSSRGTSLNIPTLFDNDGFDAV